ncbi:MAG: hypothetical protein EB133_09510, partial [Betaproteobacteria bacterium]|nr:hypothetical protein [Betaproteobacteria bacterium]
MVNASDHLRVLAGPFARELLRSQGLHAEQISAVAGAAGGPKGLILGPLDQLIFGDWLAASGQSVALIGASIGCWRLAAACAPDPLQKLKAFSQAYIEQDYRIPEGRRRPDPAAVSASFADGLAVFFGDLSQAVLEHPRYRLHVVTARGNGALARAALAKPAVNPLGLSLAFSRAWLANAVSRTALGAHLERVVFSAPGLQSTRASAEVDTAAESSALETGFEAPFAQPVGFAEALFLGDYPTSQVRLDRSNWLDAMQASCSIPMVLDPVWDIKGAPKGPYWDGGLTDYHLRLNYRALEPGLVLYPHFIDRLIPGWLDKPWIWRHRAPAGLNNLVLLCPSKTWIARLPDARLPDRQDFV